MEQRVIIAGTNSKTREYPEADDRGGVPADFKNFVSFLANFKSALGSYGLSITLPNSYWYLQHFDVVNLDKHVDFVRPIPFRLQAIRTHRHALTLTQSSTS